MPEEKDSHVTLNMCLGVLLIAVGRNSAGRAQKEKQTLQRLLFSITPTLVMGLTCNKDATQRGTPLRRHQQHDMTSHTLPGGQRTDQDLNV